LVTQNSRYLLTLNITTKSYTLVQHFPQTTQEVQYPQQYTVAATAKCVGLYYSLSLYEGL
jgi:hypothetical protein